MKATRDWGLCNCGCKERIIAGTEFKIVEGVFFIDAHLKSKKKVLTRPAQK